MLFAVANSLIDRAILEAAVGECNDGGEEENEKAFTVVDAFTMPRFTYNAERKKFLR